MNDESTLNIHLLISPELAEKMDRVLILAEDALRTVAFCEASNAKLLDGETGDFIGHLRDGTLTYWVRYKVENGMYTLLNIYCHRVKIEEDAV